MYHYYYYYYYFYIYLYNYPALCWLKYSSALSPEWLKMYAR